jgi:hypothetical protein
MRDRIAGSTVMPASSASTIVLQTIKKKVLKMVDFETERKTVPRRVESPPFRIETPTEPSACCTCKERQGKWAQC